MDKTCQERIRDELKGREESIGLLLKAMDAPASLTLNEEIRLGDAGVDLDGGPEDWAEAAQLVFDELPIEVSVVHEVKILISTGEPADYLTAPIENVRGWERVGPVSYHFADWDDHAETTIDDDSPLAVWAGSLIEVL